MAEKRSADLQAVSDSDDAPRTRRATIKDVAKRAGVGIGTVSRVLNTSDLVSPATRERVLEAVRALDFKPNRFARNLPLKTHTPTLGVLLPHVSSHSFVERLRGVQHALEEAAQAARRFDLLLFNASDAARYPQLVQTIVQGRAIDGLLIIDLPLSASQQAALRSGNIPFVCIGDAHAHAAYLLSTDNNLGGYLATRHLIELGHTQIGYVGDSYPDTYGFHTSEDRVNGYCRALREAGIAPNPSYIRLGEFGRDAAEHLAAELLALPLPPSAIFAMSDIQALGCLAAARKAGRRIPDDLSIIGFDDIEIAYYAGISTVRQHLETSGYLGMQYLVSLVQASVAGANDLPTRPSLPPLEVIARATTARHQP